MLLLEFENFTTTCELRIHIHRIISVFSQFADYVLRKLKHVGLRNLHLQTSCWNNETIAVLPPLCDLRVYRALSRRRASRSGGWFSGRRVVASFWQNFGKMLLVFGCIGTDFCKKIRVLQHFANSTTFSSWKFWNLAKFCKFSAR